jgi:hypothetical protein
MKSLLIAVLASTPILLAVGQGRSTLGNKWPERLSTRRDIKSAKPDVESIDIRNLPVEDYPLLAKFTRVEAIDLSSLEGTLATDEKLEALAALNLTNLVGISMINGRLITDKGIRALTRIQSLKGLQLEGTAITDISCDVMNTQMRLTGVNVANCRGVTIKGLKALITSTTLINIEFSADKLTQEQVLDLVGAFKNITWCEIVDPDHKLDVNAIEQKGKARGIHIAVRATGALQETYGSP